MTALRFKIGRRCVTRWPVTFPCSLNSACADPLASVGAWGFWRSPGCLSCSVFWLMQLTEFWATPEVACHPIYFTILEFSSAWIGTLPLRCYSVQWNDFKSLRLHYQNPQGVARTGPNWFVPMRILGKYWTLNIKVRVWSTTNEKEQVRLGDVPKTHFH